MSLSKNKIGSIIVHKGTSYLVEDTPKFIKIARKKGFKVFEEKAKKGINKKKIEDDITE